MLFLAEIPLGDLLAREKESVYRRRVADSDRQVAMSALVADARPLPGAPWKIGRRDCHSSPR